MKEEIKKSTTSDLVDNLKTLVESSCFHFAEDLAKPIETALKDYEELSKIDCKQNTINDFYPNTKAMIDDLLNLVSTKLADNLSEGQTYTKTRIMEILGSVIMYVKTFAYGQEFNETEKIGVREKKLKALEIIKEKKWLVEDILNAFYEDKIKYDLLKEVML